MLRSSIAGTRRAGHTRQRVIVAVSIVLVLHLILHHDYLPAAGVYLTADARGATVQQDMPSVTVMTFNLGDGLAAPDDLERFLRERDVGLVALVEVTPEIAVALETQLNDIYPYRAVRGLGIPGKALLSRYPIEQAEWLELNPGRPDLVATINLAGTLVDVVVAHPPPPELEGFIVLPREGAVEQFDRLIEIVADAAHPVLLLGDLNITPLHERHRELEAIGMQDAFGAVGDGMGFTYPIRLQQAPEVDVPPVIRIDYIWVSEEWEAVSAVVGDDLGSDHLPVIAQLRLVGG